MQYYVILCYPILCYKAAINDDCDATAHTVERMVLKMAPVKVVILIILMIMMIIMIMIPLIIL